MFNKTGAVRDGEVVWRLDEASLQQEQEAQAAVRPAAAGPRGGGGVAQPGVFLGPTPCPALCRPRILARRSAVLDATGLHRNSLAPVFPHVPPPWHPPRLAAPPSPLQKANRSRGKPLATFPRRKFRRTESGGEVGEDDGLEIDPHEALAAMMAAQVGWLRLRLCSAARACVWAAGGTSQGLACSRVAAGTLHLGSLACACSLLCRAQPAPSAPAPGLQRPPSARLAARKKSGRSDSDWDEWEEERERPRKKKKPAPAPSSKGPVVAPGLANGLANGLAAGMVPHQLVMGPNGQLTAVPAHMFAAHMAVSRARLPASGRCACPSGCLLARSCRLDAIARSALTSPAAGPYTLGQRPACLNSCAAHRGAYPAYSRAPPPVPQQVLPLMMQQQAAAVQSFSSLTPEQQRALAQQQAAAAAAGTIRPAAFVPPAPAAALAAVAGAPLPTIVAAPAAATATPSAAAGATAVASAPAAAAPAVAAPAESTAATAAPAAAVQPAPGAATSEGAATSAAPAAVSAPSAADSQPWLANLAWPPLSPEQQAALAQEQQQFAASLPPEQQVVFHGQEAAAPLAAAHAADGKAGSHGEAGAADIDPAAAEDPEQLMLAAIASAVTTADAAAGAGEQPAGGAAEGHSSGAATVAGQPDAGDMPADQGGAARGAGHAGEPGGAAGGEAAAAAGADPQQMAELQAYFASGEGAEAPAGELDQAALMQHLADMDPAQQAAYLAHYPQHDAHAAHDPHAAHAAQHYNDPATGLPFDPAAVFGGQEQGYDPSAAAAAAGYAGDPHAHEYATAGAEHAAQYAAGKRRDGREGGWGVGGQSLAPIMGGKRERDREAAKLAGGSGVRVLAKRWPSTHACHAWPCCPCAGAEHATQHAAGADPAQYAVGTEHAYAAGVQGGAALSRVPSLRPWPLLGLHPCASAWFSQCWRSCLTSPSSRLLPAAVCV